MFSFNRRNLIIILAGALIPALLLAKAGETRLKATLAGGAIGGVTPSGHAEFRAIATKARSSFEVEVEHVNLPVGTMLTVKVNNLTVGTMKLDAELEAELELNSQDGQTVPAVVAGDVVTVLNGTAAIVSGAIN